VSQAAPAAPAAAATDAQSVRDTLLSFLEQNLFQSLLTSTTLTGNSLTSPRALTEILLQALVAAHNNQPRNPADLTQLFSTFNQFTTAGTLLNTRA
jgi:hypothetical protein